ncbi:hypothetical protein H0H93_007160 [Arthromyces matolae]|nr:hypothetical protein H0H93_007160 [Arthromyces matolae]
MHPPICVAASIAVLWLSLPFVICGCKALPLPTDHQDLPQTEEEWVNHLDREDWEAAGWTPKDIVSKWPHYDPTFFCGSPFASNPSVHSGSPSGRSPAALDCQPSKSPVDADATSHGVHLETAPTAHRVASPIHGGMDLVMPNHPTESSKNSNASSSSLHTGNPRSQPPDTNPVRIPDKFLNEKWLEYLSHHAKYATFWKGYQEYLQKTRQELTKNGGTEAELDRKLEQLQLWVYRHHRRDGRLRREKLNRAIPIDQDALKELEEWERLGGDDRKDSKFQKALKKEEERCEAQAIAGDPLKPKELTHKEMEELLLIFRLERKEKMMSPDKTSEWAKWMPDKELVDPGDLDIFLEHPKYTKEKKEWIEKWRSRGENTKRSTGAMIKLRNRMTEEGREAEIPEALEDYKEEAWIQAIRSRRSAWVGWQKVRKGVKGYPEATRERINKWEIQRGDHDILAESGFMQYLGLWRKEHEKKGVHSPVELDNLLWMDRGKRMVKIVCQSRKRKRTELETMEPKLEEFSSELAAQWLGRTDLQSLELSRLTEASKAQSHD